jgi:hypothetical protein
MGGGYLGGKNNLSTELRNFLYIPDVLYSCVSDDDVYLDKLHVFYVAILLQTMINPP